MPRWTPLLLLLPALALAQSPHQDDFQDDFHNAPTEDEIQLLEVFESAPVGTDGPMTARIRNNSDYHLDRLSIRCTVTDREGRRVMRKVVFKSDPIVNIAFAFPPITTPELGIPPGAETRVELYTSDNRWTRGHGEYRYDCEVYGVSGRD